MNAVQNGRSRAVAQCVQGVRYVSTTLTAMSTPSAARLNPTSVFVRLGLLSAAVVSLLMF